MIAPVQVHSTSQSKIMVILFIIQRKGTAVKVIIQPAPTNYIRSCEGIIADDWIIQAIVGKSFLGFIFLKVTGSFCIMTCRSKFQIGCQFLYKMKLIMRLLVAIYLIIVHIVIIRTSRVE